MHYLKLVFHCIPNKTKTRIVVGRSITNHRRELSSRETRRCAEGNVAGKQDEIRKSTENEDGWQRNEKSNQPYGTFEFTIEHVFYVMRNFDRSITDKSSDRPAIGTTGSIALNSRLNVRFFTLNKAIKNTTNIGILLFSIPVDKS